MVEMFDLAIDVDAAPYLAGPARLSASIALPAPGQLADPPVICFAKPAGSYSRAYFTHDLPGPGHAAQARWHAERGWVFVAIDNLGTGDSSRHDDDELSMPAVARAAQLAEEEILLRFANGAISRALPPVLEPVRVGIGHSLGGCLTIVQQAYYGGYDGIAVLGYSPYYNRPLTPPGEAPITVPWLSRDIAPEQPGGVLNLNMLARMEDAEAAQAGWSALAWSSYYDDVPPHVVEEDLRHYEQISAADAAAGSMPPWAASGSPGRAARTVLTPGVTASEAAAITVPVLCAMGERDFVVDPRSEPRAYLSSTHIELFICPRMGHIHNLASTRELLWEKIQNFGNWCAQLRATSRRRRLA